MLEKILLAITLTCSLQLMMVVGSSKSNPNNVVKSHSPQLEQVQKISLLRTK